MIVLKDATYINHETFEFTKTNIIVNSGIDGKIEFSDKIPENAEIIDCSGQFVTKSFVVGHHHAYSGLASGMPAPAKNPENFYEILKYVWWNLDKKLDKDTILASAYATALSAAKYGSTFIIDHHASPFAIENSLDVIAEAFDRVGVSHLLCYEISDRDGKEIAEKGLAETERYLQKNQALVGLHASFTVDDDTLAKAADLVKKYDSGIHIHVAEDKYDQEHCIEKYEKRVVERLNDFGLLNSSKTILAHAIHINNNERKILANSKAFVVQNPESNLNNQVGFFTATNLPEDRIFVGTDGMHSDMVRSTQAVYFAGKMYDAPDLQKSYQRLRNNHNYLKINGFKGDGENNLIVFDYKYFTDFNQQNFLGHFFYSLRPETIVHVVSNGELIVKNKQLVKINEDEIIDFLRGQTKRLWQKL